MHARIVAMYVHCMCRVRFPETEADKEKQYRSTGIYMASTVISSGAFIDVFKPSSSGSHKYIPTKKLNNDLKLAQGAGVYGYHRFDDGSYVLLTCDGPLAYWSGRDADVAKFED